MFDSNQFFSGGAAGFYPLTIDQSLRFNDNDSAYLSRTPASAGNRKTWTWSGWVKRSTLAGFQQQLFCARVSNNDNYQTAIAFNSSNELLVQSWDGAQSINLESSALYRDVSAWYHIVVAVDTTQATNTNRVKMWINGEQITQLSLSVYPDQNDVTNINAADIHQIGRYPNGSQYLDGYLAEVHFTDGNAYTADAFGELKSGVWVAKAPSVTYGTNGFHLDFANSADIGNDISGNGNDWTPNNFTASDVVLDSPTDNFATLNLFTQNASRFTLSDGNLKNSIGTSGTYDALPEINTGKWYFEGTYTTIASGNSFGVVDDLGFVVNYQSDGNSVKNKGSATAYGDTYTANDIIGVAFDADAGTAEFYKNGDSQGQITGITSYDGMRFGGFGGAGTVAVFNFGQQPFTYTPPSGYLALSTANLPDPAIDPAQGSSPEDYFNTVLTTSTGSTLSVDVGFAADFLWTKARNFARSHELHDRVRGDNKRLKSDATTAEESYSNYVVFDADGADLGTNHNLGYHADGTTSGVVWAWKANGSATLNDQGTIDSQVSANTTSGFSICTFTTPSTGTFNFGHGLDSAPDMVIMKSRDSAVFNWVIYHRDLGAGKFLLFTTAAEGSSTALFGNTDPSDTLIYSASDGGGIGTNSDYVAYAFHSVDGFSKFGSYVGNSFSAGTDGTFVYTGFRPAFVMVKRTDASGYSWVIYDSERGNFNQIEDYLQAESSNNESAGGDVAGFDFLSNGFKPRNNSTSGVGTNIGNGTYIYMAFAEQPFKYSNAR